MMQGYSHAIKSISPFYWSYVGIALCIALSCSGAAWGIFLTGTSLVGAAIRAPRIRSKNLVSIIFCEAVAIYGIIIAIIMLQRTQVKQPQTDWAQLVISNGINGLYAKTVFAAWGIFWTGITVGASNLACGISVGVAGSGCALGDAQRPELFVRMLVVEIFASALGLFGAILGIFQATDPLPAIPVV